MHLRTLAPVLALLLTAACASDASSLNHVDRGMTKKQVIAITGEPTTSAAHEDGAEYLYYHWGEEGRLGGKARYVVKLRNGEVVAFGRPEDVGGPYGDSPDAEPPAPDENDAEFDF